MENLTTASNKPQVAEISRLRYSFGQHIEHCRVAGKNLGPVPKEHSHLLIDWKGDGNPHDSHAVLVMNVRSRFPFNPRTDVNHREWEAQRSFFPPGSEE
jgi:hypothetical protein